MKKSFGSRSFSGPDNIQFQAIVGPIPIHFAKSKNLSFLFFHDEV
jgi:hypothetical protein